MWRGWGACAVVAHSWHDAHSGSGAEADSERLAKLEGLKHEHEHDPPHLQRSGGTEVAEWHLEQNGVPPAHGAPSRESVGEASRDMEPQDHLGYSNDYRPDLTARGLGAGGKRLVGDVKFKDPLSSNPEDIKRRGCFVGFGCTEPGTRAAMYGLEQRGEKGDGDFRPGDGGGYVAPKKADYSHLLSRGDSDLQMLLFETFGGWSMPVVRLFNKMRDKVRDKLSKKQYDDEVSWTTRTWSSLMAQRMSVALHMAAAWEIARELSLAGAEDEAALFGGGVADSVA